MAVCYVFFTLSLLTLTYSQTLCGYRASTDVRQHARIDLDQREMDQFNEDFKFNSANRIYSRGGNSRKSSGLRTLRGFSTDSRSKLKCEGYYELYRSFYRRPDYADRFVQSALRGTGDFRGTPAEFRAEGATKGSQYQNVWMYVIHEMEDAISDCVRNKIEDNDNGVAAWDEAAAFYCGSLPGSRGNRDGFLLHSLAAKRCPDFRTCQRGRRGPAKVNTRILGLLRDGKRLLDRGNCDSVIQTKNKIVRQMMVPLIQGVLRYVLRAMPSEPKSKLHSEGWAFVSAILPLVNKCDRRVGRTLVKNFRPSAARPMADGVNSVASSVYRVLGCLGLSCADIGRENGLPRCSTRGRFREVSGTSRASCRACGTC